MKKLTLITLILGCTLFASCQDKKDYKAACEFNFETKPYSYKGYEVISSHAANQDTSLLHLGESYIVFHYDRLDSLTLVNIESEVEVVNNKRHVSYLPVFKEKVDIRYILDISYFFRGFKTYNHNYEAISTGIIQRPDPSGTEKEIELNGKKYTLQMIYDEPTEGVLENLAVFIACDGNKQCILKVPKVEVNKLDDIAFDILGDLDGDGKLDCLLFAGKKVNAKEYGFYSLLYLSSEAEEGDLVKHVATSYLTQENIIN